MIRLIGYIFITITLMSCQDSEQNRIARLVNEWNGKIISFPDSICLTSYRDDTVITKYVRRTNKVCFHHHLSFSKSYILNNNSVFL